MKKIIFSLLAAAALAACTKTDVTYDAPAEIGFNVVGGNITKAVVDGTTYPTSLGMYVFAQTTDNTAQSVNYINNGLFTNKNVVEGTNVWGGNPDSYYWPNVKTLHFAGYSCSGNVSNGATVIYNCSATPETLTITGYNPSTGTNAGANDLMWFPTTEIERPAGYGKNTKFVPVRMYHTCSWITFLVKGDNVTGAEGTNYTVTELTITNIDQTATVVCSATATTADDGTTVTPSILWSANATQTDDYKVPFKTSGGVGLSTTAINVETGDASTTSGNVVVIPQTPGKLNLTYTYKSSAGEIITEPVEGLDLALAVDDPNAETPTKGPSTWEPGKHYIYTITIKANEILVAPTPVDWTDSNWTVTVE